MEENTTHSSNCWYSELKTTISSTPRICQGQHGQTTHGKHAISY